MLFDVSTRQSGPDMLKPRARSRAARRVLLEHGVGGDRPRAAARRSPRDRRDAAARAGRRAPPAGTRLSDVDGAAIRPPVAGEVDVHHLDVGIEPGDVVLARQRAADAAVAALVVDRLRPRGPARRHRRRRGTCAICADQARAEELRDEALVAVVAPRRRAARAMDVAAAGDVGEPLAVLVRRLACRCARCPASWRSRARRG